MGSLAAWLLAMAGPLAARVLAALGIGWVSFAAYEVLVDAVVGSIGGLWGGLVGSVAAMAGLLGLTTAVGVMCGAMAARVSLIVANKVLGKLGG